MQYLKTLLEAQKKINSSDLHLYVGHRPYLRGSDGGLYPVEKYDKLTEKDTEQIAKTILSSAQFSKFEKEKDFELSTPLEEVARFRINFYYEKDGIAIVFRMIRGDIATIENLELPEIVSELALKKSGLVLVAGPNGSGKSTTMAAMIDEINEKRNANIITIEDPIEFVHSSKKSVISQREMGTNVANLENAAKHLFRQDVDVVVIGEIRTFEGFSLTLDIAETGHLVISTIHAEDTSSTLTRIINIFPPEQQNMIRTKLSLSLRGIIAQKLIPKKDFSGRVVATEILLETRALKNRILKGGEADLLHVLETSKEGGMHTFDDSLLKLYFDGKISEEYAAASSRNDKEFLERVKIIQEKNFKQTEETK